MKTNSYLYINRKEKIIKTNDNQEHIKLYQLIKKYI